MLGIVYYSKNGNTEILAELIEEKYNGRLIKLEEKTKRRGLIGFLKSGYQASSGKQSKLINTPWEDIKDCSELYLCTPIWAGKTTPAMNTFLANADFKNKEVIIVTVMADPKLGGASRVHESMKEIVEGKGGSVIKCVGFNGTSPFEKGEKNHIKRQFDTCL
ncbi:MAG: hypothetical protein AB1Z23_00695 [Eubacteriales bacterium]